MEKIKTLDELRPVAEALRRRGRRLVLANGVFDLLHVGHVRYLQAARALGDCLVVAVNTDASVRANRGPGRPFVPAAERMELLAALACVNFVVPFGGRTAAGVVRALRPDVHAKGTDYAPEEIPEADEVRRWGGRVVICGDPKGHSSTDLAERIRRAAR